MKMNLQRERSKLNRFIWQAQNCENFATLLTMAV